VRHDAHIDIHLDNADHAGAFTLPYVIQKTLEHGRQGKVAVSHIASLAAVSDATASNAIDGLMRAEISVVAAPTRIKPTRVEELMEAGVVVAAGTDNLRDAFVRHGRANPIRTLLLLAQLIRRTTDADLYRLWRMITDDAAKALGLKDYGIKVGAPANLVVLGANSIQTAILHEAEARLVMFRGKPLLNKGLIE
jgi:cytosine deaminase